MIATDRGSSFDKIIGMGFVVSCLAYMGHTEQCDRSPRHSLSVAHLHELWKRGEVEIVEPLA